MKVLLFAFIISSPSFGSDITQLLNITEDVRDVVVHDPAVLPPPGADMQITTPQTDIMKSITELDAKLNGFVLQPGCNCTEEERERQLLEKRIENRDLKVYFSMTYSGNQAKEKIAAFKDLRRFDRFFFELGDPKAEPINNLDKLKARYLKDHPDATFASRSVSEQARLLAEYAKTSTGIVIPQNLIISEVAIRSSVENPERWRANMRDIKDKLSFEDKYLIANQFGDYFNTNYNDARTVDHSGVVDIDALFRSANTSTPGGLCADIAIGNGQVLKELGIPEDKMYVVSYTNTGGGHAVLAVQNPDDPKEVRTLNYGQVSEATNKAGPAALVQNGILPDVGINYRMSDVNGKPVSQMSSEMGRILREVTNAREQALTITGMNLARAEVATPFGNGSFFSGNTSAGDSVIGVALDRRETTKNLTTRYGFAGFKRDTDRQTMTIDQYGLFANAGLEVRSPNLTGNADTMLHARAGFDIDMMVSKDARTSLTTGKKTSAISMDTRNDLYAAVDLDVFSNANTRSYIVVEPHARIDRSTLTDQTSGMTLVLDHTRITSGIEGNITEDIRASAAAGVVIREVGNSYRLRSSVEIPNQRFRLDAEVQGPINDVPRIFEGSTRIASVSVAKDTKKASFRLTYAKDLDTGASTGKAGLSIPLGGKKKN